MIPFSMIGNREGFIAFAKKAEEMGARLREQGIHLYYHNHHVEFAELGQGNLDLKGIIEAGPSPAWNTSSWSRMTPMGRTQWSP